MRYISINNLSTISHLSISPAELRELTNTVFDYDSERYEEKVFESIEVCFPYKDSPSVTWINIDGVHQVEMMEKIGTHFGIHPLVMEDILNTGQRPKMDDMDDYIFVVLKMLNYNEDDDEINADQISIILGQNFVISFQDKGGDIFEPIRKRIRKNKGDLRKRGADYLAYALLDSVVDNYFTIFA